MSIPIDERARLRHGLANLDPRSDAYNKRLAYIKSREYEVLHNPESDPQEVAEVCNWTCEHCKELLIPKRYQPRPRGVPGLGFWVRPTSHGCQPEKKHKRETQLEENLSLSNEKAAEWKRKLETAGLVGRLGECMFTNFMVRDSWPQAMDLKTKVEEYTTLLLTGQLQEKNWLLLSGKVGTGKSHLAAAVVLRVLRAGKSAYFREWTTYLKRLHASWNNRGLENQERESDILSELENGWLVVIDDLDKRKPSEWVKGTLYSFLNERHNKKLPTIITLNTELTAMDPVAPGRLLLQDIMGGPVLDRAIQSMWKYLVFDGPSFRSGQKWR